MYVFESTEPEAPTAARTPEVGGYGSMQPTSYWSVPEQRDFPLLLAHFGRDFEGISSFMKTKTTVMVRLSPLVHHDFVNDLLTNIVFTGQKLLPATH